MPLIEDLKKIVRGDVVEDAASLERYSRDWSLFQVMPKVVVFPQDVADIQALVKYVADHATSSDKLSLTARAGGTDMSGGPLNESIILDFTKHINHIKEIGKDYGITEPGVYYRDFEKETLKYGLLFPSYPASKSICAMGGIVANNSGGEKSLTYGKTERYVERLNVVLRDGNAYVFEPLGRKQLDAKMAQQSFEGELYRKTYNLLEKNYELLQAAKPKVSKNSTGYRLWDIWNREKQEFDFTQLFVGSQGTLGLWTEAKIKLVHPKEHSAMLVIMINHDHMQKLAQVVQATLKHRPESFESYDDHTFKLAIKYLPSLIKTMGTGNLISLGFQFLPEIWMALTGGVPQLTLVAEFTGNSEQEVLAQARAAQTDLASFGLKTRIAKQNQEGKYWSMRRQSFKLLTDHSKGKRTVPFIDDIVVRPEFLPEFLPKLNEIMSHYDLTFTVAGHIGDGNFHIIPLDKIGDKKLTTIVPELEKKVFDLVFQYEGSMSGEHNDGLVRSPFLKQMYGPEVYALFEEIKKIFDPDNIFNPRKKVGETLAYEVAHIDTDPTRHFAGEEKA